MTREEIIQKLEQNGFKNDSAATQIHHYTKTRRQSLTKGQVDNRNSTGWGRGEYVVIGYEDDGIPTWTLLAGWKKLTAKYKNQYLILEVSEGDWKVYDYDGKELGDNDYIKDLFSGRVTSNESLQKIFFGCPGTGKSYRINQEVCKKSQKDIYIEYLIAAGLATKTISNYTGVMNNSSIIDLANDKGWNITSIYDITSPDKIKILKDSKEISKLDEKGKNMYGCALEQYYKMLQTPTVFRTTFHPDTDYASFVGCYKPSTKTDGSITYTFCPQIFTDAYITAWKNPKLKIYLIIEEINRGNCAQIFGDLFQLLDRKNGYSEYPIKADNDLADYIEKQLGVGADGIANRQLCLPSNLFIYATMNTSDQSLFPMDSAFKRRWDWEYVQIEPECPNSQFEIEVNSKKYSWPDFLTKVNERITELTDSEDKMLGNFFIKDSINENEFKSKVMFYLWSEVCKDYVHSNTFFKSLMLKNGKEDEVEFTFSQLYGANASAILEGFMKYLQIAELTENAEEVIDVDASDDDTEDSNI